MDISTDKSVPDKNTWGSSFNEALAPDTTTTNISVTEEIESNKYSRAEDGLLKSINYEYNEDGSVN